MVKVSVSLKVKDKVLRRQVLNDKVKISGSMSRSNSRSGSRLKSGSEFGSESG